MSHSNEDSGVSDTKAKVFHCDTVTSNACLNFIIDIKWHNLHSLYSLWIIQGINTHRAHTTTSEWKTLRKI